MTQWVREIHDGICFTSGFCDVSIGVASFAIAKRGKRGVSLGACILNVHHHSILPYRSLPSSGHEEGNLSGTAQR